MKQKTTDKPLNQNGSKLERIRFEYTDPAASKVCVAGSFNEWEPESKTLHTSGAGLWWRETTLSPGSYEYCFVVDGKWIPDPLAHQTVANPYGGRNSVLQVIPSPEASHAASPVSKR